MDSELDCPICHEVFKEPLMLKCGHNFCRECIGRWYDKNVVGYSILWQGCQRNYPDLTCPTCKQISPMTSGGVEDLPKNITVANLVDHVAKIPDKNTNKAEEDIESALPLKCDKNYGEGILNQNENRRFCTFCNEGNAAASFQCSTCELDFCKTCFIKYHRHEAFAKHSVTKIVGHFKSVDEGSRFRHVSSVCTDHEEVCKLWCDTCWKAVCYQCKVFGEHANHRVKKVTEAETAAKNDVVSKLNELLMPSSKPSTSQKVHGCGMNARATLHNPMGNVLTSNKPAVSTSVGIQHASKLISPILQKIQNFIKGECLSSCDKIAKSNAEFKRWIDGFCQERTLALQAEAEEFVSQLSQLSEHFQDADPLDIMQANARIMKWLEGKCAIKTQREGKYLATIPPADDELFSYLFHKSFFSPDLWSSVSEDVLIKPVYDYDVEDGRRIYLQNVIPNSVSFEESRMAHYLRNSSRFTTIKQLANCKPTKLPKASVTVAKHDPAGVGSLGFASDGKLAFGENKDEVAVQEIENKWKDMFEAAAGFALTAKEKKSSSQQDSLMDKFKPKAGSWDCDMCLVNNTAESVECVACNTVRPGHQKKEVKKDQVASQLKLGPSGGFTFGSPSTGPSAAAKTGFSFGAVQATSTPTTQGGFSFQPTTTTATSTSGQPGFTFQSLQTSQTATKTTTVSKEVSFQPAQTGTNPSKSGFAFHPSETVQSSAPGQPGFQFGQQKPIQADKPVAFGSLPKPQASTPSTGDKKAPVTPPKFSLAGAPQTTAVTSSTAQGSSAFTFGSGFNFGGAAAAESKTPATDLLKSIAGKSDKEVAGHDASKTAFRGFTFSSQPLVTDAEREAAKSPPKPIARPHNPRKISESRDSGSQPQANPSASFSFIPMRQTHDAGSTLQKDTTSASTVFGSAGGLSNLSFSSIAKVAEKTALNGKSDLKGSPGAGQQILGESLVKSPGKDDDDGHGEEFEPDVDFKPVVPLPDLVEEKTGEEDEEKVFGECAKLFCLDPSTTQWKERGVGEMKILKHRESGRARLLMRREQVLKLCANHSISKEMKLQPMQSSDRAWCWLATDYSEGEMKHEKLAVKFKNAQLAAKFKEVFEECQKQLDVAPVGGNPEQSNMVSSSSVSASKDQGKSLSEMFKKKEGEWECDLCLVQNSVDSKKCLACETPKPGCEAEAKSDQFKPVYSTSNAVSASKDQGKSLSEMFKKKEGEWECDLCLVQNSVDSKKCLACETPKPGCEAEAKSDQFKPVYSTSNAASGAGSFSFGEKGGFSFSLGTGEKETPPGGFTFGPPAPDSTTSKPEAAGGFKFGSGLSTDEGFSFESQGSLSSPASTPTKSSISTVTSTTGTPRKDLMDAFGSSGFTFSSVTLKPDGDKAPALTLSVRSPQSHEGEGHGHVSKEVSSSVENNSDEVEFLWEEKPTPEQIDLAKKFLLPPSFYLYEKKPPCPGCIGCEDRELSSVKKTPQAQVNAGTSLFTPPGWQGHKGEDGDVVPGLDIHFEPVVPLPELVEVKTGEEDEEVLYCHRAKVYRFTDGEWKERGVGDLKLLHNPRTGKIRLLLRREQVLKLACHHYITPEMALLPMATSEVAWCYFALDFTGGEPRLEQLAVKFKNRDIALNFKTRFEECQKMLSETAPATTQETASIPTVGKEEKSPSQGTVEEDEEEYVDAPEDNDEDEDDQTPLFAKRVSLFFGDGQGGWESKGMGELMVMYDDDVSGVRISMTTDDGVQVVNHIVCQEYHLLPDDKKKCCEWMAKDFSTDDPVRRTFKVQFSSRNGVAEFKAIFDEGRELARDSDIREVSDHLGDNVPVIIGVPSDKAAAIGGQGSQGGQR